jgi:hypothetical protein
VSVYVDPLHTFGGDFAPVCFRHKPSCHMYADTIIELHALAAAIGLKRSWFQDKRFFPHYDLTPSKRELAKRIGAVEVSDEETVAFYRSNINKFKEQKAPTV